MSHLGLLERDASCLFKTLPSLSFALLLSPLFIYLCILFYFSLFSRSTLYPLPAVVAAWQPVGQVAMVTAR